MKQTLFSIAGLFLGLSMTPGPALAQEAMAPDSCGAVLIPDRFETALNQDQELALAGTVMSRQEFEQMRRAGANGAYGLFSAGGNYDEFKKRRQTIFADTKFTTDLTEAYQVFSSYVSDAKVEKWLVCIIAKIEASQKTGVLLLRAVHISPDKATVLVTWRPPNRVSKSDLTDFDVEGTNTEKAKIEDKLKPEWIGNEERGFIIERKSGEAIHIVLTIGGISGAFMLPAYQETVPAFVPAVMRSIFELMPENPKLDEQGQRQAVGEMQKIIGRGYKLNELHGPDGVAPLHVAAERCYPIIVNYLLRSGAKKAITTAKYGSTPLQIADGRCPSGIVGQGDPKNDTSKVLRDWPQFSD